MEYLRVRNFEKFQHYRERRPPWIKLYFSILNDPNFYQLSDASKLHTIAIMLLASQHDNKIPFNKRWIASAIQANTRLDWNEILGSSFIICEQDASAMLAECKQHAERETETETEPPIVPQMGDDGFERFWKIYPRKIGKGAALKSWKKIHPGNGTAQLILDAVEKQKLSRDWLKDDGQYIPHPATWLNQARWMDEPNQPTEPQKPRTTVTFGKDAAGKDVAYIMQEKEKI